MTARTPFRVVITGGPCAGKTALWSYLAQELPGVVPVREAATDLKLDGLTPAGVGLEAFQRRVFETQERREGEALERGRVLLCDRGLADGAAYWPGLFTALGVEPDAILSRYGLILHLAVIRGAEAYAAHARSNPARGEGYGEALAVETAIRALYAGHPGYRFLEGTLEAKKRRGLEILAEHPRLQA